MARYLIERQFTVGPDDMNALGKRSRQIAAERYDGISWEHSHVAVGDDGLVKTFCVYAAPGADDLLNHARELGSHEVLRITEIVGDVTPEDFPT